MLVVEQNCLVLPTHLMPPRILSLMPWKFFLAAEKTMALSHFTSRPINKIRTDSFKTAKTDRTGLGAGGTLGQAASHSSKSKRPGLSMNLSVVSHLLGTGVIPPWGVALQAQVTRK